VLPDEDLLPKNILLIQDDAMEAEAMRLALVNSNDGPFRVEWVRTCSDALERLGVLGMLPADSSSGIAAVLLDLFLPDNAGIETFDRLFAVAPQIPMLVMIAPANEELGMLAVQRGARDYLLKGRLDDYLLPKALRNLIERAAVAEALFAEKERAEVALNAIGEAVMSTDESCTVSYMNTAAEQLTGWLRAEAAGRPVEDVFRIVDAGTRRPVVNPMALSIREDRTVALTANCILIRRDGSESAIEESAAPTHDRCGNVSGAVMVVHDMSASRALSLRTLQLAQHDSLTDLPKRELFKDRLTQAMAEARRHDKKLAVLHLDVDRFKHVNDSLGHAVGDRLLQSIAVRLLDCVRNTDTVSRLSGDEFAVLLSEVTAAQDAAVVAGKILAALSDPYFIGEADLHVSASIGIVTFPEDGTSVESLLKNADAAMCKAKDCGRNSYQFFQTEMSVRALERHNLESDLKHALERRELVLHYQPKVNLRTGALSGVEALLRWRHPIHGLIRPARFISIAEDSGLIVPIGIWVLREACRQAKVWQTEGSAAMSIAVNVSPVELRAKDFVAGVRAILADSGLDPQNLELEITEAFMQDAASTWQVLEEIRNLGIRLAIDDFGTGYSSLSYLKRFPISTLKIDQSFVRDLATDMGGARIVSAVVNMGRSLDMRVVAEGVETHAQWEMLKKQRCPEAQGFYLSEALPAEDVTEMFMQKT
jgi:diguanylate cyclase (GGDEF)-like protein/PAS domain S-box-containing protein